MPYYSNHAYGNARRSYPSNFAPKGRWQNAPVEKVDAFKTAHPEVWAWVDQNSKRNNDFACSLLGGLNRYGSLTEKQVAAVERAMERDIEQARRHEEAPQVQITAIETAFQSALSKGIKHPKLVFAEFKFVQGRSPATILVYASDESRTYYGRVTGGKFFASSVCSRDTEHAVLAVAADPHNQAVAYGKKFGKCSACSRTLTDEKSVVAGIGPVCRKVYGWGE